MSCLHTLILFLDPFHLKYYNEYCTFLTTMNNAVQPASKENFLRLKKMILVGGKDDGVITPWQSRYTKDSHISHLCIILQPFFFLW